MTVKIPATVYILHFDPPYKHARHYIGYTAAESVEERLSRHRTGRGSKLVATVVAAGCRLIIARTWQFGSVKEAAKHERYLKGHSGVRHCPICQNLQNSQNV